MARARRRGARAGGGLKPWPWAAWAVLSACSRASPAPRLEGSADASTFDAGSTAEASTTPEATLAATPTTPSATTPTTPSATSGETPTKPPDAGVSACRLLGGPVQLSAHGAPSLESRGNEMLAVLNEDGHPATLAFRAGLVAPGVLTSVPSSSPTTRALRVPCAVTDDIAFCPDRMGEVYRSTLAGGNAQVVASSFAGTHVSAGRVAGQSAVLVYLAHRQTSEGWVTEAWIAGEEGRPERLSEDGSGATSSALAARGSSLLAVTVDSRVALTAMHARAIRYDHGVQLGEDVVTFVGGPGDPGSAAALALFPSSAGWALLPIPQDVSSFGLAIVKLDDPPRVDEPVLWSLYPDGLDPAPVATALSGSRVWVARVRPRQRGPGSLRDLELGELKSDGSFVAKQIVAAATGATGVALASDAHGALWVAWLDASGSWVERLSCP